MLKSPASSVPKEHIVGLFCKLSSRLVPLVLTLTGRLFQYLARLMAGNVSLCSKSHLIMTILMQFSATQAGKIETGW